MAETVETGLFNVCARTCFERCSFQNWEALIASCYARRVCDVQQVRVTLSERQFGWSEEGPPLSTRSAFHPSNETALK